jgi:ligand-binding SRPBCC domain-containing protein
METFEYTSTIDAPASEVFRWHWRPGTLKKLIPPWEHVEVVKPAAGPEDGQTAELRISVGPLKLRWIARHCEFEEDRQFADVQESGPFSYWHHLHRIEPITADRCILTDKIDYSLPVGFITNAAFRGWIHHKLERMFEYRHKVTAEDMQRISAREQRN